MAFFSNSGSRADSGGYNLNEKAEDEGVYESVEDRDVDLNSSQWNLNEKAGDAYHSEHEQYKAGHSGLNCSENQSGQNAQRVGAPFGSWGTNFLKDCRSKQTGKEHPSNIDRRMEDGYVASSHDDMDGSGEDDEVNRGHGEVPAEEMLSNGYYQQDGEEKSDPLHRGGMSHPTCSTSGVAAKSVPSRQKKKSTKYNHDDDDDDNEYNDENDDDDADEDDLDDMDFEPYSETNKAVVKDKLVVSENSDGDEDELELSDEEEDDFVENKRQSKRLKVGGTKTSQRRKLPMPSLRKREVSLKNEEYSLGKDSDGPNDTDFNHQSKKPDRLHQKIVGHNDGFSNVNSHNEQRTSGRRRTAKNISYAESEESDDSDEKLTKRQKLLKKDHDEDYGETIESVIWHQPKGVPEEALRNDQSIQPTMMSMASDFDQQWDDVESYTKWKGQSYLHCQWKTLSELHSVRGFKKVVNYMKRVSEELKYKRSLSREEVEVHDVGKETELDLIKQYSQVERVFADRATKVDGDVLVPEYLVKCQRLPYAESTWEKDTYIEFAQDAIDEYKAREVGTVVLGKTVDFQRKRSKASLCRLDDQPEWLKGGKLRDYQLESLNFLVNGWRNDTNVILAVEMGLGKTIQSVSMLGFLHNAQEINGPFLVVVPLSTLSNWAKEFRKWLPDMNVAVYVGNHASREPSFQLCCCKKQYHCDWISELPDEILVSILHNLDSKTAVSTSLLSRRWRHLWRYLESFHFSEVSLPGNYCRVRLEPMNEYLNKNKDHRFVEYMQWFAGLKREITLRRLSLVFSGSTECTDVVNSAIASAVESGIEDIDVAIVGDTKYVFPSWLFSSYRSSCYRSSSLTSLCLSYCKLSVPRNFGGFCSLTKLALIDMHMSLKETQLLLMCCKNLVSLHLHGMSDIRLLRFPKLKELIWIWSSPCGPFKIDTPVLERMEYCGEMLPTSTFQPITCLEHVSLQYIRGDYPECHADKLQNISTCFPHVRSLFLRYEIPEFVKPRRPAVFLNLKVLTLNISTKPSDDLLWIAMFLTAAPYLVTLKTTIRYLSGLDYRNGVVWDDDNFQHNSLNNVQMYNFTGRDNEISLARLLLCRAPNLRCMAFSQTRLQEADDHQLVPPDWPRAQTFVPKDSQFVLSKLFENVSSSARMVFMLLVRVTALAHPLQDATAKINRVSCTYNTNKKPAIRRHMYVESIFKDMFHTSLYTF